MSPGTGYLLENRAAEAGSRFDALSTLFDPWTFAHLDAVGTGPGWRCWEVGAGGPSVPRWMTGRVGPAGQVTASDIDISWLDDDAGYEVVRHDVEHEPPPGAYDLVHARLVLTHLPGRDRALRTMAASLRPGGWVVVEDFDVGLQPRAGLDAPSPSAAGPTASVRASSSSWPSGASICTSAGRCRRGCGHWVSSTSGPTPTCPSPCPPRWSSSWPTCARSARGSPPRGSTRPSSTPTPTASSTACSTSPPRRWCRPGVGGRPSRNEGRRRTEVCCHGPHRDGRGWHGRPGRGAAPPA